MKRPRESDDLTGSCSNTRLHHQISEDVLDSLDLELDSPANDGVNVSDPVLEPKHDIFLSHSGKQKDFTELLCRELERWGYNPFFDIRDDSLPKGKKFPELIFHAARQCRVAILVLSEEFFTNSKWPMLELAAFVDAQKRNSGKESPDVYILPVYLGLSRVECRKDENIRRWQRRWEEMEELEVAEKMREMDELSEQAHLEAEIEAAKNNRLSRAQQWKKALKVLGPSNGIEYEQSSRQAGLIDRIVSAVRGLLPPPNMASDVNIQAKGRICKAIIGMIARTKPSSNGARVVGIYGIGGIGKTTFCKELCYQLYKKFEGKVCHAEFGSKCRSELQKEVVEKLTNVNHGSCSLADDLKVTEYLRNRMGGEKVFLALDNVWQESKEEAMVYVRHVRYGCGSIVLVTARSIDILDSLKINRMDCFEMPELEEEDARQLLLHHAALGLQSQNKDDEKDIWYCVEQCRFSKGGNKGVHFHPLALKVLGLQLHNIECNPRKWVDSLFEDHKFDQDRKKEHPIFCILGRGYDLLREEDQLLFMDAVLSNPFQRHGRRAEYDKYGVNFFGWLSIVHDTQESSIKNRLQGLKARALLEDIGDGVNGVIVHDLYQEFAEFESSRGHLNVRRMVWYGKPQTKFPTDLIKRPPGNCWSNVERIGVKCKFSRDLPDGIGAWKGAVEGINWQHFANVVVLVLRIARNQVVDLGGLRCLRSLALEAWGGTVIGLGELRNLGWLELTGIHCSASCFLEIGYLTELQVLRVATQCFDPYDLLRSVRLCSPPSELLNLSRCIKLQELEVRCECLMAFPDLGRMRSLRRALFVCKGATEGPGLGAQLCALQKLVIQKCISLRDYSPRLVQLVSLEVLEVTGLPELELFPDLRMLSRLRELTISKLPKLLQLPQLGDLVALERLMLKHLPEVRVFPDMRLLTKLHWIGLYHVRHLLEQPRLIGLIPSQLRYFTFGFCHTRPPCWPWPDCGGVLQVKLPEYCYKFLDLSKCHELSKIAVIQTFPLFRFWKS